MFFREDYRVVFLSGSLHSHCIHCRSTGLHRKGSLGLRQVQNRTQGHVGHVHVIKVNCFLIQTVKFLKEHSTKFKVCLCIWCPCSNVKRFLRLDTVSYNILIKVKCPFKLSVICWSSFSLLFIRISLCSIEVFFGMCLLRAWSELTSKYPVNF